MRQMALVIIGFVFAAAHAGMAAEKPDLQQEKSKISYSLGYQVGADFKEQQQMFSEDAFMMGVLDSQIEAVKPLLSERMMSKVLSDFKKGIIRTQMDAQEKRAMQHREAARAFFAANAKKEGVVVLPNGLQYKVLKQGSGATPQLTDSVALLMRASFIDGKQFGNTFDKGEPKVYAMEDVIPGLQYALLKMKEGDRWQIFVPEELAYGEKGGLAERAAIFELELVSVQQAQKK